MYALKFKKHESGASYSKTNREAPGSTFREEATKGDRSGVHKVSRDGNGGADGLVGDREARRDAPTNFM